MVRERIRGRVGLGAGQQGGGGGGSQGSDRCGGSTELVELHGDSHLADCTTLRIPPLEPIPVAYLHTRCISIVSSCGGFISWPCNSLAREVCSAVSTAQMTPHCGLRSILRVCMLPLKAHCARCCFKAP